MAAHYRPRGSKPRAQKSGVSMTATPDQYYSIAPPPSALTAYYTIESRPQKSGEDDAQRKTYIERRWAEICRNGRLDPNNR